MMIYSVKLYLLIYLYAKIRYNYISFNFLYGDNDK